MAQRSVRPTLATVAAHAGVSIKTASRVLNGEKHVAETTARKVEAAAAELGFRLNSTARRLRSGGRTPLVGVVLSDLQDAQQALLLARVEMGLAAAGLRPVVSATGDDPEVERAFLDECLDNQMTGLCIIAAHQDLVGSYTRAAAVEASPGHLPIVSLDPAVRGSGITTVTMDDHQAGVLAARRLLDSGHISIGIIGDRAEHPRTTARLAGIEAELRTHSGIGWRAYLDAETHELSSAKNVVAALLGSRAAPTALITLSPTLTMGAIEASRRLDLWPALVGIDDFPAAVLLDVTVVTADPTAAVAEAVARLAGEPTVPARTSGTDDYSTPRIISRGSGEESPRDGTGQ